MASGVAWPRPVAPREPYREQVTRVTSRSRPSAARWSANARAARMGPTVCELDGPIPMEKRSSDEQYMKPLLQYDREGALQSDRKESTGRSGLSPSMRTVDREVAPRRPLDHQVVGRAPVPNSFSQ